MYLYVLCLGKESHFKDITKMFQQQEIYFEDLTQSSESSKVKETL